MAESNRTIIGIFVALLVVVLGAVGWWWLSRDDGREPVAVVSTPTPAPAPTPTPKLEERLSSRLQGTTLDTSDAVIRELVAGLSSNPKLAAWLVNEDLVRRFVAAVNNIADGVSPRSQLEFLRPKQAFKVKDLGEGVFVIDPASYRRYDLVAEVFDSLDTAGTAALYRELKPLIDDAYAEIGAPGTTFDQRLNAAFDQLLAVPIVEDPQEVNPLIVTYRWRDESLESLSGVQRHLLRMGPENVATIQHKLGELRAAIAATNQQ